MCVVASHLKYIFFIGMGYTFSLNILFLFGNGKAIVASSGVPTQFLDQRVKFIFGGDKWIKLKYRGYDKINSGQVWIKFKLMFRIGIK